MKAPWFRKRLLCSLLPVGALTALLAVGLTLVAPAADHRDGPVFGPPGITITNSRRDINDILVFRSPVTPTNTVLIFNVSPFSTATTPNVFDQGISLDFNIINTILPTAANGGNVSDDITFRVTFSAPDSSGRQTVTLRGSPAAKFPGTGGILAQGPTGTNIPIRGVGGAGTAMFRAAEQDDQFFFDAAAFTMLLNQPTAVAGVQRASSRAEPARTASAPAARPITTLLTSSAPLSTR